LTCYLFNSKLDGRPGSDVFTKQGFRAWKNVNARKKCAFLNHIGDSPSSPHNNVMKVCEDLLNQFMYINNIINYNNTMKASVSFSFSFRYTKLYIYFYYISNNN